MWKSLSGRSVDIHEQLELLLALGNRVVHIGTDAHHYGDHTDFVTAIAIIRPRAGGRVFYRRERYKRMRSLAQKLFRETELSLRAAQDLNGSIGNDVTIHVDANEDLRHRSSKYVHALSGMVVGYGYAVRVKPVAWCASHVADHVVKKFHRDVA